MEHLFSKFLNTENALQIALIILVLIIIILILFEIRKIFRSLFFARKKISSIKAEKQAAKLLTDNGFTIISSQARKSYKVSTNTHMVTATVIADYIVEKQGYTFIAEVKTGNKAPDIKNIATRRQLLEYFYVYNVDGVLLVDMTNRKLSQVQFFMDDIKGLTE